VPAQPAEVLTVLNATAEFALFTNPNA